ncbi:SPP1 [Candida theae]|uniref:SPP1 n=1 Tax=Candida theae TaxID=1198502 RepID=A0AAD5FZP7_9ASCO|nr:SPP1 [Candida theae]KAI5962004.1 SPP1 [Candida theae]
MSTEIEIQEPQTHHLKRKKGPSHYSASKRHRVGTIKTEVEDIEESSEDIAKQYKKYSNAPKYDLNSEELYCVCREPDEGELMVACDGCEEWFHARCMNIRPELSNLISKFYCKFCTWKGNGVTLWKRKCRLDECYEPIKDHSKYCSEEHGKEYMRRLLFENCSLDQGVVKKVLTHVGGEVVKLHVLGSEFPELSEVETYRQDGKIGQFPQSVRDQIELLRRRIEDIKRRKQIQIREQELLLQVKENVKTINEKLSSLIYPSTEEDSKPKSKKSKQKKRIDLCLCDRGEHVLIEEIASDEKSLEEVATKVKKRLDSDEEDNDGDDEDEDPDWFRSCICIRDRKKCYRHNGWWNLSYDDTEKLLDQLRSKEVAIETQIDVVLRDYSIQKYNEK